MKKRPLSPDVFEIDMKGPHYKMPYGALSSIANRVTGVTLTVGERDRVLACIECSVYQCVSSPQTGSPA